MLSKIEITINFNGPEAKLYHSNTQKQNSESFSNFAELFLSSLLHYNLFHLVKWVQQP